MSIRSSEDSDAVFAFQPPPTGLETATLARFPLPPPKSPTMISLGSQSTHTEVKTRPSSVQTSGMSSIRELERYVTKSEDLNFEDTEDSPYPEVRAAVSNYDDPDIPVLTFRVWSIGIVFGLLGGGINYVLTYRSPNYRVANVLYILLAYPVGKLLARILPENLYTTPRILVSCGFPTHYSFNPGPFNIKEHAAIAVLIPSVSDPLPGLGVVVLLEEFYGVPKFCFGSSFLFAVIPPMFGFAFAGLFQRFLIHPGSATWPEVLLSTSMFNAIHADEERVVEEPKPTVTRFAFFMWVLGLYALYAFIPMYLFQALLGFSLIAWIAPRNLIVNHLFGGDAGLGMNLLSFEWSRFGIVNNPMVIPWWATANMLVGFLLLIWTLTPILYYNNVWYTAYLPIGKPTIATRLGETYNITQIISNFPFVSLNQTAYASYSPAYLSMPYITAYAAGWVYAIALLTHTFLNHGKEIHARIKNRNVEEPDIHYRLILGYKQVPDWWFAILAVTFFSLGIVMITVLDLDTPIWMLLFAWGLAALYLLPLGYLSSRTACLALPMVLFNILPGYVLPGKPLAFVIFRMFVQQPLSSALQYIPTFKFAHYMKIPPRTSFLLQLFFTILGAIQQTLIKRWISSAVPDLCAVDHPRRFSCSLVRSTFDTSVIWGVLGPQRIFSPSSPYRPLLLALAVGAVLPIPFYILSKSKPLTAKYPWILYIHIPLICIVPMLWGTFIPAGGVCFFFVSWFFQSFVRRNYFLWWRRYNYLLGVGLFAGSSITAVIAFIFSGLAGISLEWWGNTVVQNTTLNQQLPYLKPPTDGFGPLVWH